MMDRRPTTPERILAAGRRIFNQKGYAATTLTEIAKEVGISQGNLTYHFPTKRELVERLVREVQAETKARRATLRPGGIVDDYVAHLLFAMNLTWENRFLLRDRAQFEADVVPARTDPEMAADFRELHRLLKRIERAGMFRRSLSVDLDTLTRSLWIVSRYWMDHLIEFEGVDEITWKDQERGIRHHLAVLLPNLRTAFRGAFEDALAAAPSRVAKRLSTE